MKLRKSIVGFGGVVLAIAFATGLALNADAGSNCSAKTKADKASTGCTAAQAAGCTAAQAGGCTAAGMKATTAGCPGAASASSCPGAKTASAGCCGGTMTTAECVMPGDAHMTRVDVPGGIDLVFTSADLGAVETFLNSHMSACGDEATKSCGRTCSVTKTDQAIVLSVRGENAESCCVGMMTAAAMDQEKDQAAPKAASQKS